MYATFIGLLNFSLFHIFGLQIDCIHFAQSDPASSPEVSDLGEWKNVRNARNVRNADSIAHPILPGR